jgi:DOPA 4,5-dioxygenase
VKEDFHAHVYFDAATRETAKRVQEELVDGLAVDAQWRDGPIGPHPVANFRVKLSTDQFGEVVPWLMRHRSGLSVLVHPFTEDSVGDHTERALWLGDRVALDIDFLRRG